ncbi:hypothetical protein HDF25_001246 [Pedobacter cryoconitis]|uniref:Uncharacterized protein n=1 Tax=Pedobacter cryoconitis TaxID=188932 RepID=A0A7X0J103_9SPHI|nr:hypothetical protein [Pedobacter cryoconitis]
MSYTNEQLTELVNEPGFLYPQSLKLALKKFITARFHGGNRNQLTSFKKLTITTDEN